MTSGLPNDEKSLIRQKFATGEIDRAELMSAEMKSYHGPGTCTFYEQPIQIKCLWNLWGYNFPAHLLSTQGHRFVMLSLSMELKEH